MDKGKVKFILIALAGLVVLFIIYKLVSKKVENKLDVENKKDNADADLEIQKELDEYAAEKRQQIKEAADELADLLSEKQKAQGIETLGDYIETLSAEDKADYDTLYSEYVYVMKTSPDLMSFTDLKKWKANYDAWSKYNAEYINLTGMSTVFFDYMDDPEALRAEVETAKAKIEDAWNNAWDDECALFHEDVKVGEYGALKGVPYDYIDNAQLARYLAHPSDVAGFHRKLSAEYVTFTTHDVPNKLEPAYQELKKYFNSGYVRWKNSAKNFVRGANDLPQGLYDEIKRYGVNAYAYFTERLRQDGGVNIWSRVDRFNAPHDKKNYNNFYDAAIAVANFQQQYEGKTNPVWFAITGGVSAAIQKNAKVKEFLPEKLKSLMYLIELGQAQHYTEFGMTKEKMPSELSVYSWELYGFPDNFFDKLASNKADINDWVNSDDFKKTPLYEVSQERYSSYTPPTII